MPQLALRRADNQLAGMLAKQMLDRFGLGQIAQRRAGAVASHIPPGPAKGRHPAGPDHRPAAPLPSSSGAVM